MNPETKQTGENQTTNQKPRTIQSWLWPALTLLALGGGLGVWWWQQQNINSLNSQISDLNSQIDTRGSEDQSQPQLDDTASTYRAQVGKFTLTLGDYGIVVLHDAGAEGSPITQLLIAQKSPAPGVVTSNMYEKAEITAIRHGLNNNTFDEAVAMRLGNSENTKLAPISIDGVTAEVYKVDGLDYTKRVFFSKGEILYEIELTFTNEKTDKMLDAIIKGFRFD